MESGERFEKRTPETEETESGERFDDHTPETEEAGERFEKRTPETEETESGERSKRTPETEESGERFDKRTPETEEAGERSDKWAPATEETELGVRSVGVCRSLTARHHGCDSQIYLSPVTICGVLVMLRNFFGRVASCRVFVVFGFSGFSGSCFMLRKFEKLDRLVVMGLRTPYSVAVGLEELAPEPAASNTTHQQIVI